MKLSSYLDPKLIFTNLESQDKFEAIEELIDKVALHDKNINDMKAQVKKAVLTREHDVSTAMGSGIAIPHARVEGFDDFVVAIGILKDPIKSRVAGLKTEDNVKILLLIVSQVLKNKKILKMMSGFLKIAGNNPKVIQAIKYSENPDDIFHFIKDAEIEIDERITAQDILSPDVIPVHPRDTLEEVAKRLIIEEKTGLPVLDINGKFLGEITEKELIQFGMPKYTTTMSDLSFLTVGEPFEEFLKNEKTVTIEDHYRTEDVIVVDRKCPIMEICFLMVNKGKTRIYVEEDGRYYGMIQRSDIIKKVLHI